MLIITFKQNLTLLSTFPYAFTVLLCENFEMETNSAWPLSLATAQDNTQTVIVGYRLITKSHVHVSIVT